MIIPIRNKLLNTKGLLFEATTDRDFGCDFTLAQRDRIRSINITAGNTLGQILVQYSHTTAAVQRVKHETSLTFA